MEFVSLTVMKNIQYGSHGQKEKGLGLHLPAMLTNPKCPLKDILVGKIKKKICVFSSLRRSGKQIAILLFVMFYVPHESLLSTSYQTTICRPVSLIRHVCLSLKSFCSHPVSSRFASKLQTLLSFVQSLSAFFGKDKHLKNGSVSQKK